MPLALLLALAACTPAGEAVGTEEAHDAAPAPSPVAALPPGVMDRKPARRTLSPDGRWDVRVAEGGALTLANGAAEDHAPRLLDTGVDARVGFHGDTLYYARAGEWNETDLWRVRLPDGTPEPVTTWPGSEDRPVVSPDGKRLAFVSGRTGLASWWVIELGQLPAADGVQLTNKNATRRPGQPPDGWMPPPDGVTYAWTTQGLTWVAEGRQWSVSP